MWWSCWCFSVPSSIYHCNNATRHRNTNDRASPIYTVNWLAEAEINLCWKVWSMYVLFCVVSNHFCQGGYVIASVCPALCLFVCLFIREQDYAKCFWSNFRETLDYCYGKNEFNIEVDPTQNGQLTDILDLRYNVLHVTYFHQHSLGVAAVLAEMCVPLVYNTLCLKKWGTHIFPHNSQ